MGKVTNIKPMVAIVCGSGLGEIADLVEEKQIIPYADIPEFPRSTGRFLKRRLIFFDNSIKINLENSK
jgi:purine-nucleoside phosphorylase